MTYLIAYTGHDLTITHRYLDGLDDWRRDAFEDVLWGIEQRFGLSFVEIHRTNPELEIRLDMTGNGLVGLAIPNGAGGGYLSINAGVGPVTYPYAATHELGHILGADHVSGDTFMQASLPAVVVPVWRALDDASWDAAFPQFDGFEFHRHEANRRELNLSRDAYQDDLIAVDIYVDDVFVFYLGRRPAESGLSFWSDKAEAGHNIELSFVPFLSEPEPASVAETAWVDLHF